MRQSFVQIIRLTLGDHTMSSNVALSVTAGSRTCELAGPTRSSHCDAAYGELLREASLIGRST